MNLRLSFVNRHAKRMELVDLTRTVLIPATYALLEVTFVIVEFLSTSEPFKIKVVF